MSSSDDLDDDGVGRGDDFKVKVGICAMNKKTHARPMKEILKRLKQFTNLEFIVFTDDTILNEPYENWPIVECLISFYSTGFPLDKAIQYAKLRKPLVLNDLQVQYHLQDRRETYRILEEAGLDIPRYAVFNRDENGKPSSATKEIEEVDDIIKVDGKTFTKPFVEKPVDAEDHNIYIYYPSKAGGGHQKLFRKIGSKSSAYSPEGLIRRTGSYIYEDFMHTDGTDVKVYTIGEEYAHAEARKAPVLDGNVERDSGGKEVRYPVILTAHEKKIAKNVCKAFKQTVNGFDLLRANGKSLICDVNGFSFVKTSQKYYDDASQLLAEIILQKLAPQLWIPQPIALRRGSPLLNRRGTPIGAGSPPGTESCDERELRCVIALIRHGDRTPKQKMKMIVTHPLYQKFFEENDGAKKGQLKIKNPKLLQELLDIARNLLEQIDTGMHVQESRSKLAQMKTVLEMYGHFSGINRKIQFKAIKDKRNEDHKLQGRNRNHPQSHPKSLLLILKWGGELTPMGKQQAEDLGKAFRCVYPESHNVYGKVPGFGFLRLHSTYRHDLKIYASDEGRVQMTAAAFAKGLLALEGELTPILVSLVHSDKNTTDMLDTPADVQKKKLEVKSRLHDHLHSTQDFTLADEEKLSPNASTAIIRAMREIKNPYKLCETVYALIQSLVKEIGERFNQQITNECTKNGEDKNTTSTNDKVNSTTTVNGMEYEDNKDKRLEGNLDVPKTERHKNVVYNRLDSGDITCNEITGEVGESDKLYAGEQLNMMKHRWEKLEKDFKNEDHFDISLIPDIYDCTKYDYLHNRSLGLSNLQELYSSTKLLADIVIPLEYGISQDERLTISKAVCHKFFKKIKGDLQYNVNKLEDSVYRLDPSTSSDIANPHRHVRTRLYFSSESHVHSVLNGLHHGELFENPVNDSQWQRAINYIKEVSELNYLTQILFMQYEDLAADPLSNDRFHIEVYFSPGVKNPVVDVGSLNPEMGLLSNTDFSTETTSRLHRRRLSCDKEDEESMIQQKTRSKTKKGGKIRTPPLRSHYVCVQGVDVIETNPFCNPLISLHSNIGQKHMEGFLEELTRDRTEKLSPHTISNCIKIPEH